MWRQAEIARAGPILESLGTWLVRWLELLGQNPSPARDHGLCAWQYLHQARAARPGFRGGPGRRAAVDDPHLSIGLM